MHCPAVIATLAALLTIGLSSTAQAQSMSRFIVYFPQVVKGTLQTFYETSIVISNPGSDVVEVILDSNATTLLQRTTIQLNAGETRRIVINTEPFQAGWVRLDASRVVAAAAHILSRPSASSSQILSQVTVLGQKPATKAVLPVFRNGGEPSLLAENTGIAIVGIQPGKIKLTLRDPVGGIVVTRSLNNCSSCLGRDFSKHLSGFVAELFPNLPATFTAGSLTLEYVEFEGIPRALAVTALYFNQNDMWAAAVQNIDVPGKWFVRFKSEDGVQQTAQLMASQYGFTIDVFLFDRIVTVTMLEEVARAVSRDPRVEMVEQNNVFENASTLSPSDVR